MKDPQPDLRVRRLCAARRALLSALQKYHLQPDPRAESTRPLHRRTLPTLSRPDAAVGHDKGSMSQTTPQRVPRPLISGGAAALAAPTLVPPLPCILAVRPARGPL